MGHTALIEGQKMNPHSPGHSTFTETSVCMSIKQRKGLAQSSEEEKMKQQVWNELCNKTVLPFRKRRYQKEALGSVSPLHGYDCGGGDSTNSLPEGQLAVGTVKIFI